MSLRSRRVPAFLGLIARLAGLTAAGASIALVFVDESTDLRVTLCATIAAAVAVVTLVSAPAVKPYPALAGRRPLGVARLGRLLVRVCWLLRVGVTGAAAWFITWNAGSAAIQPLAAGLVALSMILVATAQVGQHLAGFVTAVDDLRGPGLLRRAGAIVVAAVAAGTAGYLAALLERFRSLADGIPCGSWREEWGLPVFLAGLLVALVTILVVTLVAGVVGAAMLSIAFTIGPGTTIGRWLIKFSPVRYTRWVDSARISVVGFTASFPVAPDERATRWIYEGVRDSSGPLDPVFLGMLADDVARAVADLAPAGDRTTSVALRAVGDHEEESWSAGPRAPAARERTARERTARERTAKEPRDGAGHGCSTTFPRRRRCGGSGWRSTTSRPGSPRWCAARHRTASSSSTTGRRTPSGPSWRRNPNGSPSPATRTSSGRSCGTRPRALGAERLGLPAVELDW